MTPMRPRQLVVVEVDPARAVRSDRHPEPQEEDQPRQSQTARQQRGADSGRQQRAGREDQLGVAHGHSLSVAERRRRPSGLLRLSPWVVMNRFSPWLRRLPLAGGRERAGAARDRLARPVRGPKRHPGGRPEHARREQGGDRRLGQRPGWRRYLVLDQHGRTVHRGRLARARGTPAPWHHAYRARLASVSAPGGYRVRVPAIHRTSRPWIVRPQGSGDAIAQDPGVLRRQPRRQRAVAGPRPLAPARRDGQGRPPRRPALRPDRRLDGRRRHAPLRPDHLLRGGAAAGGRAARSGAGGAARRRGRRRDPLARQGAPGTRPVHRPGRRRARPRPRLPRPRRRRRLLDPGHRPPPGLPRDQRGGIGGDIAGQGGRRAGACVDRTHRRRRPAQARQWYAAGGTPPPLDAGASGRLLPRPPLEGLDGRRGGGALPLDRRAALPERRDPLPALPQSAADGTLGVVDSFASFAAADVCGALGAPALGSRATGASPATA